MCSMSVLSLRSIEGVVGQSWPVLSSRDLKLSAEVSVQGTLAPGKPHTALGV